MFKDKKYDPLFVLMDRSEIDCFVIAPSADLRRMIGFSPNPCERFQALFIQSDRSHFIITNKIYYEDIKNNMLGDSTFYLWEDAESWVDCVVDAFKDSERIPKTVAVNKSVRGIDLIDIQKKLPFVFFNGNELLEEIRIIKSSEDIKNLKTAARMADEVMQDMTKFIKPGLMEKEIQIKIAECFAEKGADETAFAIVASGQNNSCPHYCNNDRIITEKDVIILDFGCRVNGFCSDISRTFFVGSISEEEKKIYQIVSESYQAAANHVKEGVLASGVDQKARYIIKKAGYGGYFLNRTGHGIGVEVHEAPDIKGNHHRKLEKGMAFSIEPGIYVSGKVGMRIEDIFIINEKGEGEPLNHFNRGIIVL